MNPDIGIADIIGLSGSVLSIIAAFIFIFLNSNQSIPKLFLTITIIAIGYGIFITLLLNTGLILKYPFLYRTGMPFAMVIGPSVYFYILTDLIQPLKFPKRYLLHLIPAAVIMLLFLPYHFLNNSAKIRIIENRYENEANMLFGGEGLLTGDVIAMLLGIYTLIYLILGARLLLRNHKEILSENKKKLSWYVYMLFTIGLIFTFVLIASILPGFEAYSYFSLTTSILNFSLLFYLFTNPDILYGKLAKKIEAGSVESPEPLDDKNLDKEPVLLDDRQIEQYCDHIDQFISDRKPFLDRKLRITDMSSETGIPRHHLSWLLNNVYGMNFNDFINEKRLKYIEDNITEESFKKMTLEGIAYEAGFNSRTTFTHAVKKFYNKTPSEYFNKRPLH